MPPAIACFISPHGFGHAARVSAVLNAAWAATPTLHAHLFTTAPEIFFRDSLTGPWVYHPTLVDVGLVQPTPLHPDLPATVNALRALWPFAPDRVHALAQQVRALGCTAVWCDIAPLGLAVAEAAGLPGVLMENFTWDWIYAGYAEAEPDLRLFIEGLGAHFARASLHLQTEPLCAPVPTAQRLPPLARRPRHSRAHTRQRLQVHATTPLVLLTMGGVRADFAFAHALKAHAPVHFVIPGGAEASVFEDNLRLLPHHSGFYHPDLVAASDTVIGKLGYSTLAEAATNAIPFGFIGRLNWRESPPLADYVTRHGWGTALSADTLFSGTLAGLEALLAWPHFEPATNGASQAARWLLDVVGGG